VDRFGIESVADLDWKQYKDYTNDLDERIKGKRGGNAPF
jgi:hypothetical protein